MMMFIKKVDRENMKQTTLPLNVYFPKNTNESHKFQFLFFCCHFGDINIIILK